MREIYYFLNLTNILIHPHFGDFSNSTGKFITGKFIMVETTRLVSFELVSTKDLGCDDAIHSFHEDLIDKEQYALQMVDSFGKPPSGLLYGANFWLGGYDECFEVNKITNKTQVQYAIVSVTTSKLTPNPLTNQSVAIDIGACYPVECSSEDLTKVDLNAIR